MWSVENYFPSRSGLLEIKLSMCLPDDPAVHSWVLTLEGWEQTCIMSASAAWPPSLIRERASVDSAQHVLENHRTVRKSELWLSWRDRAPSQVPKPEYDT